MTTENAIAEYSVTTAALAKLKTELAGKVYAVDNATGMALAKLDRRGLVTLRTDLEKKRKEIKAPALAHCALIDNEAKRITLELRALEDPIDAQIGAQEAIEEAKRAEKAALAAAAQKVLDDKIIEIGKLPLRCIDMTSDDITLFIAKLDATPIGGEFTGDTRKRAEDAKEEAITAIRGMLEAKVKAEEIAATLKAEQEAEAVRVEAERVERERMAAVQREQMAAQQAELAEQKRLQDIEAAKMAEEKAEMQAAMLKASEELRAEREQRDAERRQIMQAEEEKQAAIDAENKRAQDEAAAAQREIERQAAIVAEQSRVEAEKARKVAEKKAKLLAARCDNAEVALVKILQLCREDESGNTTVAEIALIAEASI